MDNISGPGSPSTASLPASLGATPNLNASPEAVGKQFESMFASMLIKQMRQTLDGESMFGKDGGDVIGGMFDQFLGDHLGRAGGFGIGQMIRRQLEQRAGAS